MEHPLGHDLGAMIRKVYLLMVSRRKLQDQHRRILRLVGQGYGVTGGVLTAAIGVRNYPLEVV